MIKPTQKASTFANRKSRHTDPSLQKSLLCHRRQKKKSTYAMKKLKPNGAKKPQLPTSVWHNGGRSATKENLCYIWH